MNNDVPDVVVSYEIRRTGIGKYYIVAVDSSGNSENVYSKGKLMEFSDYADAKKYKERVVKQLRSN